jgi:hypothetical protein
MEVTTQFLDHMYDRQLFLVVNRVVTFCAVEITGDVCNRMSAIVKLLFKYAPDAEVTGVGGYCKELF